MKFVHRDVCPFECEQLSEAQPRFPRHQHSRVPFRFRGRLGAEGLELFEREEVEANDPTFTPALCAEWLEGRLPRPVTDSDAWTMNDEDAG